MKFKGSFSNCLTPNFQNLIFDTSDEYNYKLLYNSLNNFHFLKM